MPRNRFRERLARPFKAMSRRRLEAMPKTPWVPRPIRTWLLPFALVAIAVGGWLYFDLQMAAIDAVQLPDDGQAELEVTRMRLETIRNTLTVAAGLGGAAALVLSFRRQQHDEYHSTQQRISELRIQAVEQLSSPSPTVRIGGLHNLERLGVQHEDLRQVILDEICSYLRQPFAPTEPNDPEREVRRFAQEILERRLRRGLGRRQYWSHERIDLEGARLFDAKFHLCHLHNVSFRQARFEGIANFGWASFSGFALFNEASFDDMALFIGADFDDHTEFNKTSFNKILICSDAAFRQGVQFDGASFAEGASFEGTVFSGGARFRAATFHPGCNFRDTLFLGDADFKGASFGNASFIQSEFRNKANFTHASFQGEADFWNLRCHGMTAFDEAVFGSEARFWAADFRELTSFEQTRFATAPDFADAVMRKMMNPHTVPAGWQPEIERRGLRWRWKLTSAEAEPPERRAQRENPPGHSYRRFGTTRYETSEPSKAA